MDYDRWKLHEPESRVDNYYDAVLECLNIDDYKEYEEYIHRTITKCYWDGDSIDDAVSIIQGAIK
jgi:hypothetical protein